MVVEGVDAEGEDGGDVGVLRHEVLQRQQRHLQAAGREHRQDVESGQSRPEHE